jgi:hypothetical protein
MHRSCDLETLEKVSIKTMEIKSLLPILKKFDHIAQSKIAGVNALNDPYYDFFLF